MKSLEELRQKHANELAKAEREWAIANELPVAPKRVMEFEPNPWVSYEVKTVAEAIEIFKQFRIVNHHHATNTFGHLKPMTGIIAAENKYGTVEMKGGPFAFNLEVDQLASGHGASAELKFFAYTEKHVVQVEIKFGSGYIGSCPQLNFRIVTSGPYDHPHSRNFNPNEKAKAACDHLVTWGTGDIGPVKNSAKVNYCFKTDKLDGEWGYDHVEALTKLEALAKELGI